MRAKLQAKDVRVFYEDFEAIKGVSMGFPERQATALRMALLVHKMIFVRGQEMTHRQHVAVAEALGQPTLGHPSLRLHPPPGVEHVPHGMKSRCVCCQ